MVVSDIAFCLLPCSLAILIPSHGQQHVSNTIFLSFVRQSYHVSSHRMSVTMVFLLPGLTMYSKFLWPIDGEWQHFPCSASTSFHDQQGVSNCLGYHFMSHTGMTNRRWVIVHIAFSRQSKHVSTSNQQGASGTAFFLFSGSLTMSLHITDCKWYWIFNCHGLLSYLIYVQQFVSNFSCFLDCAILWCLIPRLIGSEWYNSCLLLPQILIMSPPITNRLWMALPFLSSCSFIILHPLINRLWVTPLLPGHFIMSMTNRQWVALLSPFQHSFIMLHCLFNISMI